jgi:hypothetical protein
METENLSQRFATVYGQVAAYGSETVSRHLTNTIDLGGMYITLGTHIQRGRTHRFMGYSCYSQSSNAAQDEYVRHTMELGMDEQGALYPTFWQALCTRDSEGIVRLGERTYVAVPPDSRRLALNSLVSLIEQALEISDAQSVQS